MMMSRRNVFMVLLLLLSIAAPAHADDKLTGEQIARRMLPSGVFEADVAGKTKLRRVLVNKSGKKTERNLELLSRRKDGLVQSVVRFRSPQDVAGTAFLMIDKKGGASEQYIYLPRLRRTRRIVGGEREGSFMGSDFTYADMQPIDAAHVTNHRLPDDMVSDTPTYVIETRIHHDAGVPYGKTVSWVRKSDFVAVRTRFLDREGKLVKTLYARRVRDLEGKPVVVEARMQSENL
jgi:hypothetical protein